MILGLARTTGEEHRVTSVPLDFLRDGFGPQPLFEAIIAERGETPVGLCLYFFTFSTWLGEPGVYVQDIYVSQSVRGQGLGRRLIAAAAAKGMHRRATHLRLTVASTNLDAKHFYARIGMEHREQEDTYHLGGAAFTRLAEYTE
jgi:ribosomal protein S18 acetylase RimI-like enzyme